MGIHEMIKSGENSKPDIAGAYDQVAVVIVGVYCSFDKPII